MSVSVLKVPAYVAQWEFLLFSLHTTIELLGSQCCHRSALQAAGVVAGGGSLSIARLSILLQQVSQPQQLAVTV